MKKKNIFIVIIIFILVMIVFANISHVNAEALANSIEAADNFKNNGKSSIIDYGGLYNAVSFLYNIAMIIGIVIAAVIGIVLGNRIVFGSIDEKADAKHLIVPYLVIVGMLAFGFTIWKIVLNLVSSI